MVYYLQRFDNDHLLRKIFYHHPHLLSQFVSSEFSLGAIIMAKHERLDSVRILSFPAAYIRSTLTAILIGAIIFYFRRS